MNELTAIMILGSLPLIFVFAIVMHFKSGHGHDIRVTKPESNYFGNAFSVIFLLAYIAGYIALLIAFPIPMLIITLLFAGTSK